VRTRFDELVNGLTSRPHPHQCVSEQNGDKKDLQKIAGSRKRIEKGRRDDMQNEISGALAGRALGVVRDGVGIESSRIDVETGSRFNNVDNN
jgi:hypothetical protein